MRLEQCCQKKLQLRYRIENLIEPDERVVLEEELSEK